MLARSLAGDASRGALKRLGLMTMHTARSAPPHALHRHRVRRHGGALLVPLPDPLADVIAVCLAITGFAALAGPLASIVLIGLFIVFGNTSSGGAVPRPLLDGFFSALNPVLPQGAALSALRGVQYFGDHGIGTGLLRLTTGPRRARLAASRA